MTASFPSGHSMNAAVTYLTMAILLAKLFESTRMKAYLLFIGLLVPFLVGVSRVFVGVHWPTDVVAGWAVGAAWAILCSLVAARLQRRRTIEREEGKA